MRKIISIIGNGRVPETSLPYRLARELGRRLIDEGYRISTGGLGGVMEAASRGARESPAYREGDTIGILPSFDTRTANPYIDIPIATGLDLARNVLTANADAVIAVGGGTGTLSEIANAWALNRLIIAYRIEGWSGKVADTRIDDRTRYENIPEDRIYGADRTEDVITLLREKLPLYTKPHSGLRSFITK